MRPTSSSRRPPFRRLNTEEGYPDYVADTARVMTGVETMVSGALAKENVEDLAKDLEEVT